MLPVEVEEALAELVALGMVNSDSFGGPARAAGAERPARPSRRSRAARRKRRLALFGMADAGRWALVRRPGGGRIESRRGGGRAHRAHAAAPLGRDFLELLAREADWLPPWRDMLMCCRRLEARGEIRGGRFVAGFSGEQYATPEAVGAVARRAPQAARRQYRIAVGRRSAESCSASSRPARGCPRSPATGCCIATACRSRSMLPEKCNSSRNSSRRRSGRRATPCCAATCPRRSSAGRGLARNTAAGQSHAFGRQIQSPIRKSAACRRFFPI